MKQYLSLVQEIFDNGIEKTDRTGTGTISIFGAQRKYDLREGFPMVTTKKVRFDAIIRELLWFLRGSTNINDELTEYTPIWDAWADENGNLGPIYGKQWVAWDEYTENPDGTFKKNQINQVQKAIDLIKNQPDSRRIIVSAWNVADLPKMALMPCHAFFQFNVMGDRLDLQLYQRSADVALGVPYNIASYSALLAMVAQECDLTPGVFVHTLGDVHIYSNHVEGLKEQLKRTSHKLPQLELSKKPFWDIKFEDFKLKNYVHDEVIKFPVAV
ncbi:thymidylate synthase [Patescibacteria group bacterium]|nr:thymidylate synthase [Patescibacteria group bacterium]MBU1683190.1 thymidylate synthase [Patescibacteria group bacterium]MBU1935562.1 thymidylate synthase [Patescibacteria group bacterium]